MKTALSNAPLCKPLTQNESFTVLSESRLIAVLQASIYPGASIDSIKLVLGYCKASGLDPMQKPVHIVPMWDSKTQQTRDVIMPGINLYRTQAARSGQFAGLTEPQYGPDVTRQLGNMEITFPEWCRVTAKRTLPNGTVADFTAIEFWLENYAVKGGKEKSLAPNAMWAKRPKGQLSKCAAAQALRIAFPEIASSVTAEEAEGKPLLDIHLTDKPYSDIATIWIQKAEAAMHSDQLTKIWTTGCKALEEDINAYQAFKSAVVTKGSALREAEKLAAEAMNSAPEKTGAAT